MIIVSWHCNKKKLAQPFCDTELFALNWHSGTNMRAGQCSGLCSVVTTDYLPLNYVKQSI